MRQGDFSALAKSYVHRTGYSRVVLSALAGYVGAYGPDFRVADVGAGTGKLTENLLELGLHVTAVEPNDAMREEGIRQTAGGSVEWLAGSAERTGLETGSFDWILMGSSFHWPDFEEALREFHRVLRPRGHFTALWNPRNLAASPFHSEIERKITEIVPDLKRVSSGSGEFTLDLAKRLTTTGAFTDVLYAEAEFEVKMSRERYLGAWRSTNDIQAQAGAERWAQVIEMIETETAGMDELGIPYRTRAWTARRTS